MDAPAIRSQLPAPASQDGNRHRSERRRARPNVQGALLLSPHDRGTRARPGTALGRNDRLFHAEKALDRVREQWPRASLRRHAVGSEAASRPGACSYSVGVPSHARLRHATPRSRLWLQRPDGVGTAGDSWTGRQVGAPPAHRHLQRGPALGGPDKAGGTPAYHQSGTACQPAAVRAFSPGGEAWRNLRTARGEPGDGAGRSRQGSDAG